MTKKPITYLLAFLCLCICFVPFQTIRADEPSATITLSTSTVDVNQAITVTLTFTNEIANFSQVKGQLTYDANVIEFVPQSGIEGGGGVLNFEENTSDLTDSLTVTLTFQANKEGASTFSLQNCQLLNESGSIGTPTAASKTITVKNTSSLLSSNANLSSLTGPGIWAPEFSSEITEYAITVKHNITNFLISAEAEDSKATIELAGSQSLQVGSNNQRKVIVTAQDGTKKTYILNITREAPEETASPTHTNPPVTGTPNPTNPPEQTQIQWGTPAQDITEVPTTATTEISSTPTATLPSTPNAKPSGMTSNDLKNMAITFVAILSIIIIVLLFTVVYCMQQSDKKKKGKGKRR